MPPRVRSLIALALLSLAAIAVLIALGNWQVRRLAWKEDLIARVAERPALEAISVDREALDAAHDDAFFELYEYRVASAVGTFDPTREVRVFTSLSNPKGRYRGPGYWILTPLVTTEEKAIVFVNRGFVPEAMKGSFAPPPAGETSVVGLIRSPETGSWLTPKPNVVERVFFARHPHRIAEAMATKGEVAGFYLDLLASETPPGGLPQAGETRMSFSNDHLAYAVTWYGLAAALALVFASFAWTRLRAGAPGAESRA